MSLIQSQYMIMLAVFGVKVWTKSWKPNFKLLRMS